MHHRWPGRSLRLLAYVAKYDSITDINYYRPGDYKDVVDREIRNPMFGTITDYSYYELIDNSKFMRSSYTLTEDMLKAPTIYSRSNGKYCISPF